MDGAGRFQTFETPGSDFRQTGMIEDAGAPCGFDAGSGGRYASAGFSGDDQRANRRTGQVDSLRRRNFRQSQGISRRTQNDRHTVIQQVSQPGGRRHPPGRYRKEPLRNGGVIRAPKADEGSERKRKEESVALRHAGRLIDRVPARAPPLPRFGCVQPAHGSAAAPGRLRKTVVFFNWISQQRSVGR